MTNTTAHVPPRTFEPVIDSCRQASAIIMRFFHGAQEDLGVEIKEGGSPVSRADTESSALLTRALTRAFPGTPVVSEEDALPPYEERSRWKRFFLVDPLDGTKEFLRGSRDFAVNVALVEDGAPLWGVMQCPALDLIVVGGKGIGAWMSDGAGVSWSAIVPPAPSNVGALRAVLSQSHRQESEQSALDRFGVASVTRRGSSLKFLLVAQGEADVYFRRTPTWEWDTAAGQAILEGVGCVVCDVRGDPLKYNRADPLNGAFLACQSGLQEVCLERIRRAWS